jgi:hypothetical protein
LLSNGRDGAVNPKKHENLFSICRCGKVKLEAVGTPIVTLAFYCRSCLEAGQRLELSVSSPPVLGADGGTDVVVYRKDRVRCVMGAEYFEEHRLKPGSPTRRVVATCCNSAMFLDSTKGHWLSMYRNRFPTGAPPLEMRVMTRDRRASNVLADDVPNYSGFFGKFMLKLLVARIAMGLHRTDITWGKEAYVTTRARRPTRFRFLFSPAEVRNRSKRSIALQWQGTAQAFAGYAAAS